MSDDEPTAAAAPTNYTEVMEKECFIANKRLSLAYRVKLDDPSGHAVKPDEEWGTINIVVELDSFQGFSETKRSMIDDPLHVIKLKFGTGIVELHRDKGVLRP